MYTDPFDRTSGLSSLSPFSQDGFSVFSPELPRPLFRRSSKAIGPNRAAELLRYGKAKEGCISLAQGEGTLPTPSFICEAAERALKEGKTFYNQVGGLPELRQEISAYYKRIYQVDVPASRITVTGSGTHAVHTALLSILEDGDEVVAVTPIWKNLIGITEQVGGVIREFPMVLRNGEWNLDLQGMFDLCSPRTRAILIVTPNNPTGWTMSSEDIECVMGFARERGIWVIADEVYGRCVYEGACAPSFLDHSNPDDRLYIINSFSKTWAMTGWRMGWLIGPPEAEDRVRDLLLYETMGVSTFMQHGAIEALRKGEDFLETQKSIWKQNLALINVRLPQMKGVRMASPPAAFYAFLEIDGCDDSFGMAKDMIDEVGLSLAPGGSFGQGFNGYLRLCFAVSPDLVAEALGRLQNFLNKRT